MKANQTECAASATVELRLLANIKVPETITDDRLVLCSNEHLLLALKQTQFAKDFLDNMARKIRETASTSIDEGQIKRLHGTLSDLEKQFIVPNVQITFRDYAFQPEDLPKNNIVSINASRVERSGWFVLANQVISLYNFVLESLYRVSKQSNLLTQKLSTLRIHDSGISGFPHCFRHWNMSCTIGTEEYSTLSFELTDKAEPNLIDYEDSQIANLSLGIDEVQWLSQFWTDSIFSAKKWHPAWEYIFYAIYYSQIGNWRHAIIDLDIASNNVLREWLKERTQLAPVLFQKLISESSTGQLIDVAKYMSNNEELHLIRSVEKLHNLRNTIMHRDQRRISSEHMKIFEQAKDALELLAKRL